MIRGMKVILHEKHKIKKKKKQRKVSGEYTRVRSSEGKKELLKCSADLRANGYNKAINKDRLDPP